MSVPVSATEELVMVARGLVRAERGSDAGPHATMEELTAALATWDHDSRLPQAAKADRVEVQVPVPVPVYMTDPEVLDRAADILEDKIGDVKGFRKANNKALIQVLPELARKIRREKRAHD